MNAVHAIKYLGELQNICGQRTFGSSSLILCTSSVSKCNIRTIRTAPKKFQWSSGPKSKPRIETVPSPFEGINVESGGVKLSRLWKPLGFTVAFSTASFAGAAIWQYENKRARMQAMMKSPGAWIHERFSHVQKQGKWRQQLNTWWNGLTEGQRLFFPICFANCMVFLAWRVPHLQSTMVRYFCSNPASKILCWPMVLSTFSHYSAFHLFANMYVLHSFSSGAVMMLGKEQFLGLYLSAGVISSMTSYVYKVITHQAGLSLGASGAIMAVLGYVCTQWPDSRLNIIFLPHISFTAGSAIKAIMALDTMGMLLRWKLFDHAAHLGGALCGIAWCYWGNSYIWQKKEPFVAWWHDIRGSP
ncbi:presenilin-associated rhomboid-like protein, mitochondrial [Anabrus simplex]|uniref:presenilin-associated rhomboid-like protein, mitochondrial n=1 Tax=Anabrus simplex TaxID=316456 RepID=UPI0034DDC406